MVCFAFCNSNVYAHTPSRLSRLQDGLLLSEKFHSRDFEMEQQTRAKQICDDDRKRFERLHGEEWERRRVKRLCSRLPPETSQKDVEVLPPDLEQPQEQRAETARIVEDRMLADQPAHQEQERVADEQLLQRRRAREQQRAEEQRADVVRIVTLARQEQKRARDKRLLERHRAREEQRAKDAQIIEERRLARQQVWQEQRLKDEQLLETYRLAKLRDRELRNLRVQETEQRRRFTRARDSSVVEALIRHEASKV
jgi:hypothetical protein